LVLIHDILAPEDMTNHVEFLWSITISARILREHAPVAGSDETLPPAGRYADRVSQVTDLSVGGVAATWHDVGHPAVRRLAERSGQLPYSARHCSDVCQLHPTTSEQLVF
jgi:hypothetical protein